MTEAQHAEIARCATKFSISKLTCRKQDLAHAVAHPLYSINGKLDASHLERLILLFKHFEGINGLRDALLSDLDSPDSLRPDAGENRRARQSP